MVTLGRFIALALYIIGMLIIIGIVGYGPETKHLLVESLLGATMASVGAFLMGVNVGKDLSGLK